MFTLSSASRYTFDSRERKSPPFHRVVEEAVNAVAVVLVVLRRVDAALSRDAVRAAGAVLVAEALDVVAHLAERSGCRPPGEAATHDDDVVLAAVGRSDELARLFVLLPAILDGTGRFFRSKFHDDPYSVTKPAKHRERERQIAYGDRPRKSQWRCRGGSCCSEGWLAPSVWKAL